VRYHDDRPGDQAPEERPGGLWRRLEQRPPVWESIAEIVEHGRALGDRLRRRLEPGELAYEVGAGELPRPNRGAE